MTATTVSNKNEKECEPKCLSVCCPPNLFEPHDTIFTKETAVTEIDDQRNRKMNDIGTELI
jgi:hypothetical protein